jgi:NTP pyrophosphatase (non-canonical NTP hydrolase)
MAAFQGDDSGEFPGGVLKHFNGLSAAEDERLALLSEELGEALQAIAKIQRHGYQSYDPTLPVHRRITNRVKLEQELGDLTFAIALLTDSGDLLRVNIDSAKATKRSNIGKWLHHNGVAEVPK